MADLSRASSFAGHLRTPEQDSAAWALTRISPPPPPTRDQAACAADRHRNAVDLVTKARAHPEPRRPPALSVRGACAGRCRAARAAGAGAAAGSAPRSRAEPAARSAGQRRSRGAEESSGGAEGRPRRSRAEPAARRGAAPRSRARHPPARQSVRPRSAVPNTAAPEPRSDSDTGEQAAARELGPGNRAPSAFPARTYTTAREIIQDTIFSAAGPLTAGRALPARAPRGRAGALGSRPGVCARCPEPPGARSPARPPPPAAPPALPAPPLRSADRRRLRDPGGRCAPPTCAVTSLPRAGGRRAGGESAWEPRPGLGEPGLGSVWLGAARVHTEAG